MKLLVATLLLSVTTAAGAVERVRNGQFDQGNTGFTTTLTYKAPVKNGLRVAGTYTIGNDPSKLNPASPVVTDRAYGHDSGMGNYLIVNGSTKANSIVWQQSGIKVIAGKEYLFDNWFAALYNSNRPVFQAFVNYGGSEHFLGTWRAERGVGIWQGMEARFVPTTSLITITLRNLTGADAGNNFALDAIRLLTPAEWTTSQGANARVALDAQGVNARVALDVAAVPEPATWALLLTGFGAVGTVLRRRQRPVRLSA